jgi:hypothetical protein
MSENACYCLVHSLLSSPVLHTNNNLDTYNFVLFCTEVNRSVAIKDECRLDGLENKALKRTFGPKIQEVKSNV